MSAHEVQTSPNYFRVAWQSALAAGLCLGFPAGLLFWLILFQRLKPSQPVERALTALQNNEVFEIIGLLVGALGWGMILSKISGYRPMWRLVAASMLGVSIGQPLFWGIYAWINYDFSHLPLHLVLAIHLIGLVFSVTFCTGPAYGLILRNGKAALTLASTTSFVSILATAAAFMILDQLGIRVGTGNAAMSKVTAICTMVAAITGGMVLGIGLITFVGEEKRQ